MKQKLLLQLASFLFFTLIYFNNTYAQKQANTWYFGYNAGLDFNSGVPVALNNGLLNTQEGCASISDVNGNLLFYTDGSSIYNKSHAFMVNGLGLHGNTSSTQSALIVQQPGSTYIYYVFTIYIDFEYAIVDMSLNAGMGGVTVKNVPIMPACQSERQCATAHANGMDIWILMHEGGQAGSTGFNAFLLSTSGLNLVPVHSNSGIVQTFCPGEMKFSPNGYRIGISTVNSGTALEIFDFDRASGTVSNNITVPTSFGQSYGLEFSPDNSKLYCTANFSSTEIWQYDVNAGSPAAVIASGTIITTIPNMQFGGMQLAPDGKIYVGLWSSNYLCEISDPNVAGAGCNFVQNSVSLNGGTTVYGLPSFVSSYFGSLGMINSCFGDSTYFTAGNTSMLFGVHWNFGDSISGASNISYDFQPAHLYSAPGSYSVEIILYLNNGGIDTIYQQVNIHGLSSIAIGADTVICEGSSLLLNAGSGFASYLWQDGSIDSTFLAADSGIYIVTVTDGVCESTDSIHVLTQPCTIPVVALSSSDTLFCDKQCIDFFDLSINNPTSWQWFFPGADSTYSTLQNPTNICYNSYGSFDVTLIACNAVGCDTLFLPAFIKEFQPPAIPLITGSSDTLFSTPAYSYQWYDGSGILPGAINSFYVYLQPGNYFVIVTDSNGCASSSGIITTGIKEPGTLDGNISITPNPSDDIITISCIDFGNGPCQLSVINSLGQPVLIKNIQLAIQPGNSKLLLPVGEFPQGIYLVKIDTGKKTGFQKFVIIHQ